MTRPRDRRGGSGTRPYGDRGASVRAPERPRLYLVAPVGVADVAVALDGGDVAAVELGGGGASGSTPTLPSPIKGEGELRRRGIAPPPPSWGRVGWGGAPAAELIATIQARGVAALVRDDTAAALGADGVYLSAPNADVAAARRVLGRERTIGAFAADRHGAMEAGEAGADFVAFDDLDLLAWWAATMVVPCLARGAVTLETVPAVVAAGADFIAVDDAVWRAARGPRAAIAALNAAVDTAWAT